MRGIVSDMADLSRQLGLLPERDRVAERARSAGCSPH
jgi:hypothetical protein